jgi:hypothetical protein
VRETDMRRARFERLTVWFIVPAKFFRRENTACIGASRVSDGERHAH